MSGEGGRTGAGWRSPFLPSFPVICSELGMDGARGPLTCSTLSILAPRCCWTWSRGEYIVFYHRFWVPAPALHLGTVLSSSW